MTSLSKQLPRTKIVCTLGPASCTKNTIRELIQAGMSVSRINFSHGSHSEHAELIHSIREISDSENCHVAIMADLQGPKIRIGDIPEGSVELLAGQEIVLGLPGSHPPNDYIPLPHKELFDAITPGQRILLDDGEMELKVGHVDNNTLQCIVINGGLLRSHKGVNVPDTTLPLSALTEKDIDDVRFAIKHSVDFIALSFVRRPEHVHELRHLLRGENAEIPIIAKIEKPEAITFFDTILDAADGIMVARGDLGVETAPEEVPFLQKKIITACNRIGKPVITATQMLQSMVHSPRPTRAEASDVANAILDGTDAVMLSGETAVGNYPVHSTGIMATICRKTEAYLPTRKIQHSNELERSVTDAISAGAVDIANELGARAIVTATNSGRTARMVARHRPGRPIIAVTPNEDTRRRLSLVWGVRPVGIPPKKTTDEMITAMLNAALGTGIVSENDTVVLTAGIPFGSGCDTNLLKVHTIGSDSDVWQ